MSALVEARGVTKHFPLGRGKTVHTMDDVSLTIAEKEIVGLVGESGSGKSTFGSAIHLGASGLAASERRSAREGAPRVAAPTEHGGP